MEEPVLFGSRDYFILLVLLLSARGADFLSTWIATPNLVLEANPLARKLGWKWGIPVNLGLCAAFACWPLPAIIICTTSVLVAARNFQVAWLMHTAGEENYRAWMVERLQETTPGLFIFCLLAQTILTAGLGLVLMYFSHGQMEPLGIGTGIVAYAAAVTVFTCIALWKNRRAAHKE